VILKAMTAKKAGPTMDDFIRAIRPIVAQAVDREVSAGRDMADCVIVAVETTDAYGAGVIAYLAAKPPEPAEGRFVVIPIARKEAAKVFHQLPADLLVTPPGTIPVVHIAWGDIKRAALPLITVRIPPHDPSKAN
jgi:hypothetical protein